MRKQVEASPATALGFAPRCDRLARKAADLHDRIFHHYRRYNMALEKLTAKDLSQRPKGRPKPEYVAFISSLRSGEGGTCTTKSEKATKQTIKNRLKTAASHASVKIRFMRTPPDTVTFRVTK